MIPAPFFHEPSDAVRFWVEVDDKLVGASIGRRTLHFRYQPTRTDDEPLATYAAHAAEIESAVRRRVAAGSIEPIMLREHDVRADLLP
jgi:hypothetical protein